MERSFYLDLARCGHRLPIGADLVLHEEADPERVMLDGEALGRVVALAAARYRTPLAFPLMDLRLEKADLAEFLGVAESEADTFHFGAAPGEEAVQALEAAGGRPFRRRNRAHQEAVQFVAGQPGLVALGMAIGPFSLMTKLLKDPISAVALACGGLTGEEDPEVLLAERALRMAEATVLRSARAQIAAGAKAMLICEPAANIVYLSPRHMRRDPEVLERWILGPNRRLAQLLESHDVDLIFHDCGELEEEMVRRFAAELRPKVLSLGSSRSLWEDAALVAPDIVLYGNLPTKTFYSDSSMPVEEVRRRTRELVERMRACGHPHILGSECDVLHVPDADATIRRKVDEMLSLEV